MLHNRSLKFRCETVRLRVENSRAPFTNRYAESQVIRIPINHGISNYFCDEATLERLKRRGDAVFLLDETKAELGGSEFQKVVHGVVDGRPSSIDLAVEKKLHDALLAAIREGLVALAHDLSEGGLAVALAECCITGGIGASLEWTTNLRADIALFSESLSRVVVGVSPNRADRFAARMVEAGVLCASIGVVGGQSLRVVVNGRTVVDAPVEQLARIW